MRPIYLTGERFHYFSTDWLTIGAAILVLSTTNCIKSVLGADSAGHLPTAFDENTKEIYFAEDNFVQRLNSTLGDLNVYTFHTNVTILEIIKTSNNLTYILTCLNTTTPSCSLTDVETSAEYSLDVQEYSGIDAYITNILYHNPARTCLFRNQSSKDIFFLSVSRNVASRTIYKFREALAIFIIDMNNFSLVLHQPKRDPVILKVETTFVLEILHEVYFNNSLFHVAKSSDNRAFYHSNMLMYLDVKTGRRIQSNINCMGESAVIAAAHYTGTDNIPSLITLHKTNGKIALCALPLPDIQNYFTDIGVGSSHTTVDQRYCTRGNCIHSTDSAPIYPEESSTTTLFFRQVTPLFHADASDLDVTRVSGNILAHLLTTDSKIVTVKLYNNAQIISVTETITKEEDAKPSGIVSYGNALYILDGLREVREVDLSRCGRHVSGDSCLRDVTGCTVCNERNDNVSKEINTARKQMYCVPTEKCSSPVDINMTAQVAPKIVSPCWGPKGGGNLLTVEGDQLDLAQTVKVNIGDQLCDILSETVTRTRLLCTVPPHDVTATVNVTIQQDGKVFVQTDGYEYVDDPVITSFHPRHTIESGGTRICLTSAAFVSRHWSDLSLVTADPHLRFQRRFPCVQTDTGVSCTAPPIPRLSAHSRVNFSLSLGATGDVLSSRGIINTPPFELEVWPDPIIKDFWGQTLEQNQDLFAMKGKNLRSVNQSEISVLALYDSSRFEVKNTSDTEIICLIDSVSALRLMLKVMIGENLVYYPGVLVSPGTTTSTESTTSDMTPQPDTQTVTTNREISAPLPPGRDSTSLIAVAIVCTCVIVAIILAFATIRFLKKRKNKRLSRQRPSIVSYHGSLGVTIGDRMPSRSLSNASLSDGLLTDGTDDISKAIIRRLNSENLIIKRANLTLHKLIGRGNFGSVFKGVIQNEDEYSVDVAVKTLHLDEPRKIDIQLFLKEAYVMKDFQHLNVMTLVGICLDLDEMPLVILPYMEHGDLLSYLHEDKHIPTVKDLVSFGLDIAKGMAYLAQLKFVHRDLAARNCMLDSDFNVKVADFGLSRDIYESSYYSARSKGTKLPVKWMAIDSLTNGVFNEKTDVTLMRQLLQELSHLGLHYLQWSFGVTLWELMTRGVRPYATVDNWEMERYLNSGRRLPQPMYCPNQLYKIMRKCWAENQEDRPCFAELQALISDMLERVHLQLGDADKTTNIHTTYVNLAMGASYYYENEAEFNRTT